jgi:hypothetical protein
MQGEKGEGSGGGGEWRGRGVEGTVDFVQSNVIKDDLKAEKESFVKKAEKRHVTVTRTEETAKHKP